MADYVKHESIPSEIDQLRFPAFSAEIAGSSLADRVVSRHAGSRRSPPDCYQAQGMRVNLTFSPSRPRPRFSSFPGFRGIALMHSEDENEDDYDSGCIKLTRMHVGVP